MAFELYKQLEDMQNQRIVDFINLVEQVAQQALEPQKTNLLNSVVAALKNGRDLTRIPGVEYPQIVGVITALQAVAQDPSLIGSINAKTASRVAPSLYKQVDQTLQQYSTGDQNTKQQIANDIAAAKTKVEQMRARRRDQQQGRIGVQQAMQQRGDAGRADMGNVTANASTPAASSSTWQ